MPRVVDQDVIVLGAGISGMCAAISAAEAGARVTLLEKGPDAMHSNTAYTGGGWSVVIQPYGPYSVDEAVDALVQMSHGFCNAALARTVAQRVPADFTWLREEVRLPVRQQNNRVTPDGRRWGSFMTEGKGAAIPPHVLPQVERRGVRVQFGVPARQLITDQQGRVAGVRVLSSDGPIDYEAGAVVIATGGFEANGAMVLQYCGPDFYQAHLRHLGPPTHQGDGQRMAMEVGASFMRYPSMAHCSAEYHGTSEGSPVVGPSPIRVMHEAHPWGIWLNRHGRRYVDETLEPDPLGTVLVRQPGGVGALVFDSAIRARFPSEFDAYDRASKGGIRRVESLHELARVVGAPPDEVERTLREFNDAVSADGRALGSEVPKGSHKPTAARLETPPYYVIYPLYGCLNTIWGGLEVTPRMEVVDRDGQVIPNLFAAGSTFGGLFHGEWSQFRNGTWTYRSSHDTYGSSLPTCLVTGRLAGESAASLAAGH